MSKSKHFTILYTRSAEIVMYSVNEENDTVTIHAVFTAGKDLSEDVFE